MHGGEEHMERRGDWRRGGDRRHGIRRGHDRHVRMAKLIAMGFAGGLVVGAALWSTQLHFSRRDLFSVQPLRRLAALGYLAGQPSIEAVRLLRDYIQWETRPVLRRRGEEVLRQVEAYLALV